MNKKAKDVFLMLLMIASAYIVFLFQESIPMLGRISISQVIIAGLVGGAISLMLSTLGLLKEKKSRFKYNFYNTTIKSRNTPMKMAQSLLMSTMKIKIYSEKP